MMWNDEADEDNRPHGTDRAGGKAAGEQQDD
jgi:hypothetical protein